MSDELKPCPFCGGEATMGADGDLAFDADPWFWPQCLDCGFELAAYDTMREAAALWNTRPNEDALTAELATLRAERWQPVEDGWDVEDGRAVLMYLALDDEGCEIEVDDGSSLGWNRIRVKLPPDIRLCKRVDADPPHPID